jgi:hypothetical protein
MGKPLGRNALLIIPVIVILLCITLLCCGTFTILGIGGIIGIGEKAEITTYLYEVAKVNEAKSTYEFKDIQIVSITETLLTTEEREKGYQKGWCVNYKYQSKLKTDEGGWEPFEYTILLVRIDGKLTITDDKFTNNNDCFNRN